MNLFKGSKFWDFWILSGWTEKYKPASSKSDSSWDNSYCVRLVIVSLAVDIGKLQRLVSEDNFFRWVYNDFYSDLLLCNKSSFKPCWSSLLRLLMVPRMSLLQIDKASLFEIFASLNIKNFGYTPNCLQLLRKWMSHFRLLLLLLLLLLLFLFLFLFLFFLYCSLSYLPKSLTVTFLYFRAKSL